MLNTKTPKHVNMNNLDSVRVALSYLLVIQIKECL